MNDFSSTTNSGLLKADYDPKYEGDSALKQVLKKKLKKSSEKNDIKDQFNESDNDLGPLKG